MPAVSNHSSKETDGRVPIGKKHEMSPGSSLPSALTDVPTEAVV